jgi:hypothetical protein
MMKSRLFGAVCAVSMLVSLEPISEASPLRLDYDITSLGGSSYQYDFNLVLDNNDGSWTSGQGFDWVIFGDRAGGVNRPSQFGVDWLFTSVQSGWTGTSSGIAHQGPAVCFGASCAAPLWVPAAVGDSVSWSGRSNTLISGTLYWSYLLTGGGTSPGGGSSTGDAASIAEYVVANSVANTVPIPAAVWLFGSGLIGLVGVAKKKNRGCCL